ncbi:uncharacterized protein LOC134193350 isoform X2 [Corticium candelabrum]|uniref:uncharacterized protein LOC134193350 isoform X2 n=1 Tax=Corticium candelabrum TaxID=121492 RepID=UPI002E257FA0|nr:uncharacterized protein LOC134193350 isoform X2 [Corticium candelabrum]
MPSLSNQAIPHELLLPLITMLNSPADSDWRDLAKRFGIQEKDIDKMDNEGGRASALMQKLINCGITMQEVAVQAMDMKRHDVVSLLENAGYQTSVVGNGHSQVISPSAFQKHSASLSRTVIPEFSTLSSPSLTRSPGMLRRIGTCTSENTRSPTFRSLLTNTRHQQRDGIDPLCGNQLQLSIPSYLSRKRTPEQYPISSNSSRSYSDGSCDHIQAADVQKVALVIGNSEYLVPNLVQQNFVFEARALAAQLKEMNWTVTLVENATLSQLQRALVAFSDKCQQESPVFALVFYGGHVITTNGTSYLVHVDLSLPLSVAYVSHCLVPLRNLLQLLSNCVVVVAIISCIREQTSVACSGMSFSGGDITIPKLSSQTCVIIAANSQQPVSVATSFAMQLTLCVKKSYDVSLCSIVEHIGWSGDTTVASRCHCYCRSLMNLNFYSISQTVETCVLKTDMLRRVLVFGRESDESDLHRLMEVFDKEDWRAEYCTNTANPITTLQTFLFNTGVTQTAQTAALVILMGNLSTIDQEPTLFFHPLSPSPTTGSTLSVEPPSDALPLSMVADMMAEAIIGPKLLVVNNCDLSMDVDEKYCSRMVMPRVNMLVSISRYRIQQYVSRFIPSWKDSKFESLLNVFREIAPNTTKSCLFTI